jgi:RNA polymerase sigma-70 factor (ECF subfamily)
MMDDVESDLVKALQAGDSAAFSELVTRFGPRLAASATRLLGSRDEAQDAVQETLLAVWKSVRKFEGASSLYSWIHRILINTCLARLRAPRASKEIRFSALEKAVSAEGGSLLDAGQQQKGPGLEKQIAMRRAIERALQQIPEEFRIVLLLRDVEELSSKQAAAHLGIPDALLRQRLHRARGVMAELLKPELCSGPELTCGGRVDLLMDFIDGLLPEELATPVGAHIRSCVACTRLLDGYKATIGFTKALRQLTASLELSPEVMTKILQGARI